MEKLALAGGGEANSTSPNFADSAIKRNSKKWNWLISKSHQNEQQQLHYKSTECPAKNSILEVRQVIRNH
jgi:hypothetical protein